MKDSGSGSSLQKVNGKSKAAEAEQENFLPKVDFVGDSKATLDGANGPLDRLNLVYFIMMIHGIGTLMPWNMFINANDYFVNYKLGGEDIDDASNVYRKYFLSALGFVAQIPNVLLNGINLFAHCGGGGNLPLRITTTIIVVLLMFIITVVLAMIDSTAWPAGFFWITMITVVIINMANGVYQNSIYGTAACLPMKYTNAVVLGSNTSGTITAILNLLSIWLAPDPRTAAIYYFIAAILVLVLAYDAYYILPFSAFFRYHRDKAARERQFYEQQNTSHSDCDEVRSSAPPFFYIFQKCYKQHLGVWFVFFVTLTCFPAIQANIVSSSPSFPINDKYFAPVTCFLFFNFFAMLGNLVTEFVRVPSPKWAWVPVAARGVFIPFFMLSNFNAETRSLPILFYNDYIYVLVGVAMAFSSGYFSSICMMYAPGCVEDKYKGTAGMMAAFFLIFGIFSGICFSFVVIAFVENVGWYEYIPPIVNGTQYANMTTSTLSAVTIGS